MATRIWHELGLGDPFLFPLECDPNLQSKVREDLLVLLQDVESKWEERKEITTTEDPDQKHEYAYARDLWERACVDVRTLLNSSSNRIPLLTPLHLEPGLPATSCTRFIRPKSPPSSSIGTASTSFPTLQSLLNHARQKPESKEFNFTEIAGGIYQIPSKHWLRMLELGERARAWSSTLNLLPHPSLNHFMVDLEYDVPVSVPNTDSSLTLIQWQTKTQNAGCWLDPLERHYPGSISGEPKPQSVFSIMSHAIHRVVPAYPTPDVAVLKRASGFGVSWIKDPAQNKKPEKIALYRDEFIQPQIWRRQEQEGRIKVTAKSSFHIHWFGLLLHPWEAYVLGLCMGEALQQSCLFPAGTDITKVVDQAIYGNGNRCLFADKLATAVCRRHFREPPLWTKTTEDPDKATTVPCPDCKGQRPRGRRFELYAATRPGTWGEPEIQFPWAAAALHTLSRPTDAMLTLAIAPTATRHRLSGNAIALHFPRSSAMAHTYLSTKLQFAPEAERPWIETLLRELHDWSYVYYIPPVPPPSEPRAGPWGLPQRRRMSEGLHIVLNPKKPKVSEPKGPTIVSTVTTTAAAISPAASSFEFGSWTPVARWSTMASEIKIERLQFLFRVFPQSWCPLIWKQDWKTLICTHQFEVEVNLHVRYLEDFFGPVMWPRAQPVLDQLRDQCKETLGPALQYCSVKWYFSDRGEPAIRMTFYQNLNHYAWCLFRKHDVHAPTPRHESNRSYVTVTPTGMTFRDLDDDCKLKRKRESTKTIKYYPLELLYSLFVDRVVLEGHIQESQCDLEKLQKALDEDKALIIPQKDACEEVQISTNQ